jgi:hypothetical protein
LPHPPFPSRSSRPTDGCKGILIWRATLHSILPVAVRPNGSFLAVAFEDDPAFLDVVEVHGYLSTVCLSRKVTVFLPASDESTSTLGLPTATWRTHDAGYLMLLLYGALTALPGVWSSWRWAASKSSALLGSASLQMKCHPAKAEIDKAIESGKPHLKSHSRFGEIA